MKHLIQFFLLFLTITASSQEINYEKIALKFVLDSADSFLNEPKSESKILINSCSQTRSALWPFYELKFPFSNSDSIMIMTSYLNCQRELSQLINEYNQINHFDSISSDRKYQKGLNKYILKKAKCDNKYHDSKGVRIKLNEKQKQIFSYNGYRYGKENAGGITVNTPHLYFDQNIVIEQVNFYINNNCAKEIYIFLDLKGAIVRYYCFDKSQRR